MTRARYSTALILQSFGVSRKMKRMTDAAGELHLMQEGEELLGELVWKDVENIEDLSMEYWSVRRIESERAELNQKIEEAHLTLDSAHQERTLLTDKNKDVSQDLYNKREALFETVEEMNLAREEILAEAAHVKRRYEALAMKVRVLKDEGKTAEPDFQESVDEIAQLKQFFGELKAKQDGSDEQIKTEQDKLQELQDLIDETNKGNKNDASEVFALISRANREISGHRAELGLLADEQAKLFRQIGRHLNLHSLHQETRRVCRDFKGLLEQIRILRQSVMWNKKLITRLGG